MEKLLDQEEFYRMDVIDHITRQMFLLRYNLVQLFDSILVIFLLKQIYQDIYILTAKEEGLQTCKTIMMAIYNSIKYENCYPVIMCGDNEAQHVITKALNSVREILPSTDKITVHLIH